MQTLSYCCKKRPEYVINIYFILSSEINAYQKQIKVISITNEMICYSENIG